MLTSIQIAAQRSVVTALLLAATLEAAEPAAVVDLAELPASSPFLQRVHGHTGDGRYGVPVAGGHDVDGDGFVDTAVAFFITPVRDLPNAGEVVLVFGDGTFGGALDTAVDTPRLLRFRGTAAHETTGSEIWIDDVTGDGLGDLLIGRQSFSPDAERPGAGALSVVAGGPELRQRAAALAAVDLADPGDGPRVTTIVGGERLGRFAIWMRTGDVDGDGIADLAVGADREGPEENGAVWVIRGGPHLAAGGTLDLALEPTLAGHLARLTLGDAPPDAHFGATCQVADLDGNGRAEVIGAATLLRAGALLGPGGVGTAPGIGGTERGTVAIVWDDHFPPEPWPAGYAIDVSRTAGGRTLIHGGAGHQRFGEELLGGFDLDGDGTAELFVGDLFGDIADTRTPRGVGQIFFDAARLRNRELDTDTLPDDLSKTTISGPGRLSIAGDTAASGDFDGDGHTDLAFASPTASFTVGGEARDGAGIVHVLHGRRGAWPALVELEPDALPPSELLRITEIRGALGAAPGAGVGGDSGDTLAYSAAAGDLDGDGRSDLIVNEMEGNGVDPDALDVGNLVLLSGALLGGGSCLPGEGTLCLNGGRFAVEATWENAAGERGAGRVVPFGTPDSGLFWFFAPENWEVLVKVLDGCAVNGHVWVFAAATTDVAYTLEVTDTRDGAVRRYRNPLGVAADAVTDTRAFAACPY